MITALGLTKRFGRMTAVDNLSFEVKPGRVTGFLGPNGSGKSTTMRLLLGLDRPDGGSSAFGGRRYAELRRPLTEVGALLDAKYAHPTRRARDHLRFVAASNGLPVRRVDEMLALVGLEGVARRRVGGFSLGMQQRLGLAAALLGDPHTLLLDEPANGLDPEGIQWIRRFLRAYAEQGRTVFVSSHLLSEMALMADDLVVIGRGRLISQGSVDDFVKHAARSWVRVRSPQAPMFAEALGRSGATVRTEGDGALAVDGAEAPAIGELAARHGVVLHELSPQTASLEEAFLAVTGSSVEYSGGMTDAAVLPERTPSADVVLAAATAGATFCSASRPGGVPLMVDVIRSELVKYRTVRSSVVMAVLAVAVPVGLTVLLAALIPGEEFESGADAFNIVTGSLAVMQLLVGVMGALVIAAEYRFGTIRVTFTAVPNRWRVIGAKVIVIVGFAVVIAVVTMALNVAIGQAILGARDLDFSLTGEGVPRALSGYVITTVLYALAGFGLGALFRSPVAAIVVVVVQPIVVEPILFAIRNELFRWLPFTAGSALTTVDPPEEFVQSALAGGLVLAAYSLALLAIGAVSVTRRDA